MSTMTKLPSTVALTACPADEDGTQIFLSGLFDVIEFMPYEPSNYVHSPGFIVGRMEDRENPDAPTWWIDEADMIEQVSPATHASMLVQERETDDYFQDAEKPYFVCPMMPPNLSEIPEAYEGSDRGHDFKATGKCQVHDDRIAGRMVAIETRCTQCGAIRWDIG